MTVVLTHLFKLLSFFHLYLLFLLVYRFSKWRLSAIFDFKNLRWRLPPSWILKISIFDHVTVIGFNICCSVPNFIKIGRLFTEIWRLNDFQDGGRPPSWISKICYFCHVAFVDMLFCFLVQNFAKIRHLVDELWPKSDFQDGGRRHHKF